MAEPARAVVTVPVATVWTSPDAPREVDRAAVRDQPDDVEWLTGLDARLRRDLLGRTLTQLLLGEPVEIVEVLGPWARVVALQQPSSNDDRGYPGWVRRAHLTSAATPEDTEDPTACIAVPIASCSVGDDSFELSAGTALPVSELHPDRVGVTLPDGRAGALAVEDVFVDRASGPDAAVEALSIAASFTGLEYLWGGTSGWGLDCSGLVHLSYRIAGLLLPRDASDQWDSSAVERIDPDEVQPGDLYFFARPGSPVHHVGFASRPVDERGRRWMLHAPGRESSSARILEEVMDEEHQEMLVGAARVRQ